MHTACYIPLPVLHTQTYQAILRRNLVLLLLLCSPLLSYQVPARYVLRATLNQVSSATESISILMSCSMLNGVDVFDPVWPKTKPRGTIGIKPVRTVAHSFTLLLQTCARVLECFIQTALKSNRALRTYGTVEACSTKK